MPRISDSNHTYRLEIYLLDPQKHSWVRKGTVDDFHDRMGNSHLSSRGWGDEILGSTVTAEWFPEEQPWVVSQWRHPDKRSLTSSKVQGPLLTPRGSGWMALSWRTHLPVGHLHILDRSHSPHRHKCLQTADYGISAIVKWLSCCSVLFGKASINQF